MRTIKTISYQTFCILILALLCNISIAEPLPGYTIITTTEIQNTSQKLPDFIAHKESLGFDVQVVTEADFGGGTGDVAAENIRTWLKSHYENDNIEYVLLIGDPTPKTSKVPMKLLYPYGHRIADDPNELIDEIVPSDLYYADLSGNWDLDGDGYYGEWGDDFGYGGVDREWEVLVGRIPYYPDYDEPNDLDKILSKIIIYENQDVEQILWRKNALLAMNLGSGSCRLGEEIIHDILYPAGWSWYRLYREESANACEPVPLPEEIIPTGVCDYRQLPRVWDNGKYGLVVLAAHGGRGGPSCLIDTSQVLQLNDDFPSFTFQASCSNAFPEEPNNLTYALLKHGAICTIGATRISKATSAMNMAYAYTSRIVTGMTCGQALFGLKNKMTLYSPDDWLCFVEYNIYGEPSLKLISPSNSILYVDSNSAGANDGSSWYNAYNSLQDALAIALPGDEIRVAQGTYKPNQGIGINLGNREVSFNLKNGVKLKGGYAGAGAPDPNARDIELHETILSGDLLGNDAQVADPCDLLDEPTRAENSHHVVTSRGTDERAVLDGFTISGGNADSNNTNGWGGGVYMDRAYPILIDCNITSNVAGYLGGGIYIHRGNPILTQCTFSDNSSSLGGGIYNHNASPLLSLTRFDRNVASDGGGIYIDGYSEPVLSFCKFHTNSANRGGGIYNRYSNTILTNCIINVNSASYGGGIYEADSSTTLLNCTFNKNSAVLVGGAVYNYWGSTPRLTNCILWGDTPDEIFVDSGEPSINYSVIKGGWLGEGQYNIYENPEFADPNNGNYHLKSQYGRYDPNSGSWVKDDVTSPCIDAGDPNMPVGDELFPNGGIINMGAYGGTIEASMSPEEEIHVGEDDNGGQVTLAQGQILVVTLETNPSTIYRWEVVEKPDSILEQIGEPEYWQSIYPHTRDSGLVIFRFRAVSAGQETLDLYVSLVEPPKSFSIEVTVN